MVRKEALQNAFAHCQRRLVTTNLCWCCPRLGEFKGTAVHYRALYFCGLKTTIDPIACIASASTAPTSPDFQPTCFLPKGPSLRGRDWPITADAHWVANPSPSRGCSDDCAANDMARGLRLGFLRPIKGLLTRLRVMTL